MRRVFVVTHGFAASLLVCAWLRIPLDAAGHASFVLLSGSASVLEEDDVFHNRAVRLEQWPAAPTMDP